MGKIFINYRRGQSAKEAQLLRAQLRHHFPVRRIFLDTKGLDESPDWLHELRNQVATSDIMISLICQDWAELKSKDGERRIDQRNDFVRFEIAEAILRGIPIIPVLLDNAHLPENLPREIADLTRPQASLLRMATFDDDADKLARRIKRELAGRRKSGVPVWAAVAASVTALAVGIYGGQYALSQMNWVAPGIVSPSDAKLIEERDQARAATKDSEARLAAAAAARQDAEARAREAIAAKEKAEAALRKLSEPQPPLARLDPRRANRPLTSSELGVLKPRDEFQECDDCLRMVVVPNGEFKMGSPEGEAGRSEDEDDKPGEGGDLVLVKIGKSFAVGKFEVTFEEWEACVKGGGCQSNKTPNDRGWGKGKRPVIDVSWQHVQDYVTWLNSKVFGTPYRLLSEAEWEYAARAGTVTRYSWGNDVSKSNPKANCNGCGSQWDNQQTAPVGSFMPNGWGPVRHARQCLGVGSGLLR